MRSRQLTNKELILELKNNTEQSPYLIEELIRKIEKLPLEKIPQITSEAAQRILKSYDFEFEDFVSAESSVGIRESYETWIGLEHTDYVVTFFEDDTWEMTDDEKDQKISSGKNSQSLKWALEDLFQSV